MRAVLDNEILAESDDIVEAQGYSYFPASTVRLDLMEKSPKTASDLECPHGVQFYDVVNGAERSARAAWSYEAPQTKMKSIDHWVGFWKDVEIT